MQARDKEGKKEQSSDVINGSSEKKEGTKEKRKQEIRKVIEKTERRGNLKKKFKDLFFMTISTKNKKNKSVKN